MYPSAPFELHGLKKLLAAPQPGVAEPEVSTTTVQLRPLVAAEIMRLKQRLLDKVLSIEGEDAIRRFLHIHQYALISIMDEVAEHPAHYAAFDCHELLDGLLSFFRQHFPDYFNHQATAPLMHVAAIQAEINVSTLRLERHLENASADPEILQVVFYPVKSLADPRTKVPSFDRIRFIKYILTHLEKICARGYQGEDLNAQLLQMLLYLNYNSKKTFMQLTAYIRLFLRADVETQQKIDYLSGLRKEVNQATVKHGTGYHVHAPTLKSQLANYVGEELDYLNGMKDRPKCSGEKPALPDCFKIKLDLSVAQLGCLLRIFTETGLIASGNTLALIRFVARNCETKKAGEISAESLRIRYYNIELGTHQAVHRRLADVLKTMEIT
jgi:hypothetical protein